MSLDFDDDFLSHDESRDSESDENCSQYLDGGGSPGASKDKLCKARYKHVPHCDKPPQVVEKRNARERKRVQTVNSAFVRLRKYIPYENRHKRLSKVKTLHKAIEYIDHLQAMLKDCDGSSSDTQTPPPAMSAPQDPSAFSGHELHEELSTVGMRLPIQISQDNTAVSMMFGQALPGHNLTAEHSYKTPSAFSQMLSTEYHDINATSALNNNNNNNNNIINNSSYPGMAPMPLPPSSSQAFFGLLPAALAEVSSGEYSSYLPPLLPTLPPTS